MKSSCGRTWTACSRTRPWGALRALAQAYSRERGERYEQQLGRREVLPEHLALLPNSLPFAVAAVVGEAPVLAEPYYQRVRYRVAAADGARTAAGSRRRAGAACRPPRDLVLPAR